MGEWFTPHSRGYRGGIFGRDLGWRITRFDPPAVMVLEAWGAFVVGIKARAERHRSPSRVPSTGA